MEGRLLGIFKKKNRSEEEKVTEEQETKPEHWTKPIYDELLELFNSEPQRFFLHQREMGDYFVKVIGRPELLIRISGDNDEAIITQPEYISPPQELDWLVVKIGSQIREFIKEDNSARLSNFFSEFIRGEKFYFINNPRKWDEQLYMALGRCQDEYVRAPKFIWFRSNKDATMFKLVMSDQTQGHV
jgi:hypothetical protein